MSGSSHLIERLALHPIRSLSINELVLSARNISNGAKGSSDSLMRSANWVQSELPVRLAHRLHDFQRLPFAVFQVLNVRKVYDMHVKALSEVHAFGTVTAYNEDRFIEMISRHVDDNINVIRLLQMGLAELRTSHPDISLDTFLERFFATRIGSRMLTEHYLALHDDFKNSSSSNSHFSGVIHEAVSMREVTCQAIERVSRIACIRSMPPVKIEVVNEDGSDDDITMAYVPEHVRFILFELMKNSIKATIDATDMSNRMSSSQSSTTLNNKSSSAKPKSAKDLISEGVPSDIAALFAEDDEEDDFDSLLLTSDVKQVFEHHQNGSQHKNTNQRNLNFSKPIDKNMGELTIRISRSEKHVIVDIIDQGKGINPLTKEKIWNYGFTTVEDFACSEAKSCIRSNSDVVPDNNSKPFSFSDTFGSGSDFMNDADRLKQRELAGYGFGLPLTRLYSRYFGGDVELLSNQDLLKKTNSAGQVESFELFPENGTTARVKLYALGDHQEPETLARSFSGKTLDPLKVYHQSNRFELLQQQMIQNEKRSNSNLYSSATMRALSPLNSSSTNKNYYSTHINNNNMNGSFIDKNTTYNAGHSSLIVPGRIGEEGSVRLL